MLNLESIHEEGPGSMESTLNATVAVHDVSSSSSSSGLGDEVEDDVEDHVIMIIAVTMLVLTAVGVLGNLCIICIVAMNRSMRNRPNALLANLAVGDLYILTICVPLKMYQLLYFRWPFGWLLCKLSCGAVIVSQAVSIYSMVALSYDRYRAIVTPMNYPRSRGAGYTLLVIGAIWFAGVVFSIPTVVFSYVAGNDEFSYCNYSNHASLQGQLHAILRCLLLFLLPLLVISGYYCLVSRKLIRSTRALPGEVHDKRSQISSRKRLAYLVLAIVGLFTVCWLPFSVFEVLFQVRPTLVVSTNSMVYLKLVGDMLAFANSSVNPILIAVVSSTYRHYIKSFLCCRFRGRKSFKRPRASTVSSKASSARTRMTEFA